MGYIISFLADFLSLIHLLLCTHLYQLKKPIKENFNGLVVCFCCARVIPDVSQDRDQRDSVMENDRPTGKAEVDEVIPDSSETERDPRESVEDAISQDRPGEETRTIYGDKNIDEKSGKNQ